VGEEGRERKKKGGTFRLATGCNSLAAGVMVINREMRESRDERKKTRRKEGREKKGGKEGRRPVCVCTGVACISILRKRDALSWGVAAVVIQMVATV
jgi:hypothetical protein